MKKSVAVLLAVGVFSSFFPVAVNANSFIRGDANSDGSIDISDGMTILRYLFQGAEEPGCLDANDSNDSGTLDLSDAIYLLSFLFFGAEAPPAPYWGCGSDPTLDNLGCETQSDACTPAVTGFSYIGTNEFGYQEFEHEQTGLEFVLVPGGSFSMGSLPEETGSQPHEWPVHTVPLSPFLIAKYEVTQKQYADVMGSNPAHFKGEEAPEGMNTDELPVESVSWNELHEEEGFLKQTKLALPTEAQWEYAARAGTVTAFSFGDDAERIDEYAWYEGNSNGVPHPVGEKLPNDFGLYDMHGNAWEWTQDEYSPDFYETMSATVQDPVAIVCPSAATKLVSCRGGSLASEVMACRAAHRDPAVQEFLRNPALGFRPVFSFAPGEGVGCTNQGALNYDEDAVIDDGSCVFDAPEIPLIRGFTTIGLNEQGLPEYRHDRTGIVCVRLPGGRFNMGSPEEIVDFDGFEDGFDRGSPNSQPLDGWTIVQGEWRIEGSVRDGRRMAGRPTIPEQSRQPIWAWHGEPATQFPRFFDATFRLGLGAGVPRDHLGRHGGVMFCCSVPFESENHPNNGHLGITNGYSLQWTDRTREAPDRGFALLRHDDARTTVLSRFAQGLQANREFNPPGLWRLVVGESSIQVWGNGELLVEVEDSTYRGGHFGIWSRPGGEAGRTGTVGFDDIVVQPIGGHQPAGWGPVHEVELSPFLIGKYEVTQEEWQLMMNGTNPSFNHPCTHDWFENRGVPAPRPRLLPYDEQLRRPVENVSWRRIQDFEERTGFTLPTEAQWEYAARGGAETAWFFGDDESQLGEYAWFETEERFSTAPVGQLLPNQFGLHDMYGNVAEWCEDIHSRDFYSSDQAGELDPEAKWVEFEGRIPHRVVRGGDYRDFIEVPSSNRYRLQSGAREAVRENTPWNYRPTSPGFPGFRVAFNLAGCTDPGALNYDENAVIDDGSCETEVTEYSEIAGFRSFGVNEVGFPQYRHDRSGIVCVRLPGGRFNMGSSLEGGDWGPVHEVELSPFLIGKYEVTQMEWEAVMGYDPASGAVSYHNPDTGDFFRDNQNIPGAILSTEEQALRPVENVSWTLVQNFEAQTGFALPTEAQWEYAARAGADTTWFFGEDGSLLGEYAWIQIGERRFTAPTGSLRPNQFGLYDMYGNVSEWCEDMYSPDFYSSPQAGGLNPVAVWDNLEGVVLERVIRGGDYRDILERPTSNPERLQSATRESLLENAPTRPTGPSFPGFRVVFNFGRE